MSDLSILINLLILLANLGITGLGLKLYTEVFKEKAQQRRGKVKSDA